jgi:uncharacterized protein involved in outer membrane biogenesis
VAISRRTKIFAAVLAIPLVLLVAFILFLKFYFTSERLKAIILPKIQAATNRDVTVREIGLSIFPNFGAEIEGLSIANRQGQGFSDRPIVSLDEFVLDVKLLPLLGNRLEINKLILRKPVVFLEINRKGEENFSNTTQEAERSPQGKPGFALKYSAEGALLLSDFEIESGDFEYLNRQKGQAVRLKGVNARLRLEEIAEVNEMRSDADATVGEFSYGAIDDPSIHVRNLHLKEKSTIHAEKDKVTLDKGEVEIQGLKLGMKGSLTLVNQKPLVDFALVSDDVDLKQVLSVIPRGLVKGLENAQVEGTARLQADIKGQVGEGGQPDISVVCFLANGKIHYVGYPKSVTDINFKATLLSSSSKSTLEVPDLSAKVGQNLVRMRVLLANFSDPALDADVEGLMDLSEVKDFYPIGQGTTLSGLLKAKVSVKGKPSQPEALRGSGILELQNVAMSSAEEPATKVSGAITFNNQVLETKELRVKYGPSDLTLSFVLRNYLSAIFPSLLDKGKERNLRPSVHVSVTSPYFESTPSKEPMVIPPFDIDATVAISKLVYKGNQPFECTDVRGSVSASERVVQLKSVSLRAFGGNMSAAGTIDLRNSKQPVFDLTLDAVGADGHQLLSKVTSFGEHIFGKLSLTAKLKGVLNDSLGFLPNSLSGDGTVHIMDGKLTGYPVMDQLASFLSLPEMKEATIKSWSHSFRISEGKVNTPDLKIATSGNNFLLSGWQGFDGSLDYRLTVKLSGALTNQFMASGVAGQVANLFKDKDGRVTLFLLVGGTTETPKFRWDTEAAQQKLHERITEEVEKKKAEAQEKAKEEIQKKLDEGKSKLQEQLKKLFKKP